MKKTKTLTFEQICILVPKEIKILLDKCKNTPQNKRWHPEGDVFKHINIVYNRAINTKDLNIAIAALFHDLGKAITTKKNKKGEWAVHGHESISAHLVKKHNVWITSLGGDWEEIYEIVKEHMRIKYIDEMKIHKKNQLLNNPYIDKIILFSKLDNMSNITKDEIALIK